MKSLFFICLLLGACGQATSGNAVSPIQFVQNPATLTGGVCTNAAQITDTTGENVVLVSLNAHFTDAAGAAADFVMDTAELLQVLDSAVLAANGSVTASLSFDLGAKGLSGVSSGSVVIIGTGGSTITNFVGSFQCGAS